MTATNPDVAQLGTHGKAPGPEKVSTTARKALSSPWASLAAIVIAVVWTIPTLGLFITSFRPESDITSSGWWTFFTNPNVTWANYDEVLNGIRAAAASVPLTTVEIARAHGLKRLARALARYTSVPGDSAQ